MTATPPPGPLAGSGRSRRSRAGPAAGNLDPPAGTVPGLGPLESAIMYVVWEAREPVTAQVVLGSLDYTAESGTLPSYSTVATVMTILLDKGLLARAMRPGRHGHRAWWYHPRLTRDQYLATIVRAVLACATDPVAVLRLAEPAPGPSGAGWPGSIPPAQVLAGLRTELAAHGVATGAMVATRLQATLALPGRPAITCRGGWITWPEQTPTRGSPPAWAVHWAGDLAGATGRLASPGQTVTRQSR